MIESGLRCWRIKAGADRNEAELEEGTEKNLFIDARTRPDAQTEGFRTSLTAHASNQFCRAGIDPPPVLNDTDGFSLGFLASKLVSTSKMSPALKQQTHCKFRWCIAFLF